jgi:hypothetical protein
MGESPGEEPAGGRQVPLLGHQHIDDLLELVDRAVEIDPPPDDLNLRFIDEPPIPNHVTTGSCGVDEQWGEPLHPAIDGHMINVDTTFSEQLLDVPVGQAIAEVPADRHHDHIRREPEANESRLRRTY